MPSISHPNPDVSSHLRAGLLLAAITYLRDLDLPHPTVVQVIEATGASRSHAYELRNTILRTLPDLERPVGRPPAPSPAPVRSDPLTCEVLRFVVEHPGCIHGGPKRQRYSDEFRRFVLDLREQHQEIDLPSFTQAVQIPMGTLEDWLHPTQAQPKPPQSSEEMLPKTADVTAPRIETILDEWSRWKGSFIGFCDHVKHHCRIPYGRTLIAGILQAHGVRLPRRRPGRSPDEKALRGQFETFFPGAQWEGDGTPLTVELCEQRFTFNVELMTDAHTDAFVGASIRNEEDSAAVNEAFDDGAQTTGSPPLAVLLDNRHSNHTKEVDEALGDTLRIRATKGRAQNKAHVEGGFGLFNQSAPPLSIMASTPRELARQFLMRIVQTWGRTINHKPRRDRNERSRVELYQSETPTPEQIKAARAALEERRKKQEQARQTLAARQDPVVRQVLDEAFARLELQDPDGNIRSAIARYPLDAVLAGVATFKGKRTAGTLPPGVDGRYLLGIVRNIAEEEEGWAISEALWRARLDVRDQLLLPLQSHRDTVQEIHHDPFRRLTIFIDYALDTDRRLDRFFWLNAAADLTRAEHTSEQQALFRIAARRIHATHRVPHRERLAATRFLAAKVLPLV